MSMHDEMSDHEILRAAADSLSGLSIARPPPAPPWPSA